jgi:hypothetical protein
MVFVECKIWPFSDEITHQEARYKAMKDGHKHYRVKALIDTTFSVNFISKSLADRLDIIDCLIYPSDTREKTDWSLVVTKFLMILRTSRLYHGYGYVKQK